MQTTYRSVGDGYCRWLEYKRTTRVFGISFSYWSAVPADHWDEWLHAGITAMRRNRYVCSYDYNLKEFVEKYPDIEDWLNARVITIQEKMNKIETERQERMRNNSGIINYRK